MLACGLSSLCTKAKSKGATFFGKINFMKIFYCCTSSNSTIVSQATFIPIPGGTKSLAYGSQDRSIWDWSNAYYMPTTAQIKRNGIKAPQGTLMELKNQ
jgi:hypothetical protein